MALAGTWLGVAHFWTKTLDAVIISGWSRVVEATGGEEEGDWFRLCLLPSLCSVGLFWVFNLPLLVWNFYPQFNPLERWKVQKGRYETKERVVAMLLLIIFNHSIGIAIAVAPFNYRGLKEQGVLSGMTGVPTFLELAWQLPACCMLYDTLFFAIHCMMHTKWLYHNIHKVHHRSKVTIGITSAYFHPIDYVLSGISVLLPPMLVSNHVLVSVLWLIIHMCETTNAHCGYDIPFLPSAKDHDFHHSHSFYSSEKYRFVTMGAFGLVWDRLFGTKQLVDEWWAANPGGMKRRADFPVEKDDGKAE
eukprot:Hpha_TRINITY_DN31032_c0_g1::TRINITY_DN31032_c0_g1_i1::g.64026::m.64026/K07750/E1.14.13.72, SC4MOL, ERG25; methylsterol monooxygenase